MTYNILNIVSNIITPYMLNPSGTGVRKRDIFTVGHAFYP